MEVASALLDIANSVSCASSQYISQDRDDPNPEHAPQDNLEPRRLDLLKSVPSPRAQILHATDPRTARMRTRRRVLHHYYDGFRGRVVRRSPRQQNAGHPHGDSYVVLDEPFHCVDERGKVVSGTAVREIYVEHRTLLPGSSVTLSGRLEPMGWDARSGRVQATSLSGVSNLSAGEPRHKVEGGRVHFVHAHKNAQLAAVLWPDPKGSASSSRVLVFSRDGSGRVHLGKMRADPPQDGNPFIGFTDALDLVWDAPIAKELSLFHTQRDKAGSFASCPLMSGPPCADTAAAGTADRWLMHNPTDTMFWARRAPHGAWHVRVLRARQM